MSARLENLSETESDSGELTSWVTVACVAGLLLFLATTVLVELGVSRRFDAAVVSLLNPNQSLGAIQEAARDLTALGGYTLLTVLVFTVAYYLRVSGHSSQTWYLIVTVLLGYVTMMCLKSLFARPRPTGVLTLSYVESSSFPSGHSMMSTITFCTIGVLLAELTSKRRLQHFLLVMPFAIAGLVGLSRVYLGVHYPTDVFAGWAAGVAWSSGGWLVLHRLRQSKSLGSQLSGSAIESDAA